MKKTIQTVIFLSALIILVALSTYLGWHFGPRTNHYELLNLKNENQRLKQYVSSAEYQFSHELFMTLLSVQQYNPDITGTTVLNYLIDIQISRQYRMNILPDGTIGMGPTTEKWYWLTAAIGDYRQDHPIENSDPKMRPSMQVLFELANKKRAELKKTNN